MLVRVFTCSLITGVICTVALAMGLPWLKQLIESIPGQSEIGPIKGLNVAYVLVPFIVSLVSRVIKLHDRISDIFRIRLKFDTEHILLNLARGAGIGIDQKIRQVLREKRQEAMYRIFYPYAGFKDPRIDMQLVRSALDNWGWFWAELESSTILLIAIAIAWLIKDELVIKACVIWLIILIALMVYHWFECRRSAIREVNAILIDNERKKEIQTYLQSISS